MPFIDGTINLNIMGLAVITQARRRNQIRTEAVSHYLGPCWFSHKTCPGNPKSSPHPHPWGRGVENLPKILSLCLRGEKRPEKLQVSTPPTGKLSQGLPVCAVFKGTVFQMHQETFLIEPSIERNGHFDIS